jgi:hypothetical protein
MLRALSTLLAPLALVALLDLVFAAGVWEPLAKPSSHAGTSVRLKRALQSPAGARLDFVTLGSSRPAYGLDHALLAATAKRHGFVHADLAMPGSHWMTIGVLARWLQREHPELRGGIVALAIQDFFYPGNGSYELGIVYPFRRLADIPLMAEHVPFQLHDVGTYGTYSALFGWRADVQDYLRHPYDRRDSLDWYAANVPPERTLFGNPESQGDMCAFGLDTLAACDAVEASADPARDGLKRQCKELRGSAAGRTDLPVLAQPDALPDFLRQTRDLVREQFRSMRWPQPPVVVLMPVPRLWMRDVLAPGLHDWARAVLDPLVREGRIRLVDATDFFDDEAGECGFFLDFYHQNAAGRERLMRWLMPQVEAALYGADAPGAGAGPPDAAGHRERRAAQAGIIGAP